MPSAWQLLLRTKRTVEAVGTTIKKLVSFLGAKKIVYGGKMSRGWKKLISLTA